VNVNQWAGPADAPDRYELIQVHSRGGEGELWRGAIDLDGVAIPVAVKVLRPGPDEQAQEAAERVRRQAELLRTLDHPNLVTVREAFAGPPVHRQGEADPSQRALYLVMNWVDGESGVEWVARNPGRDVLDSIRTIARVADAVD
jgi:eukaryotic-like serine/threonine-protein kinase